MLCKRSLGCVLVPTASRPAFINPYVVSEFFLDSVSPVLVRTVLTTMRYVVLGGGIAGVCCAEELCKLCPEDNIVLLSNDKTLKVHRYR